MNKRYFCRDKKGKDHFFIELLDEPILNSMWLRFSFEPQFILTPEMHTLIRCIEERLVQEPLRLKFVERLFDTIQKVPGIEQLYFKESVLDSNGSLLDENYLIQRDIASEFDPQIFKPYSDSDGFLFDYLAPYLFFASQRPEANTISRELFVEQINQSKDLQNSYATLVDSTAKYFVEWSEENGNKYGLYWMNTSEKTALFFVGSHCRHTQVVFVG